MAGPLNFFIEQDPVVLDYWIMDKAGKKLRKASVEEIELWEVLLLTESEFNSLKNLVQELLTPNAVN